MSTPLKNPFIDYLQNMKVHESASNPVHEIVNIYYELRGWDKKPVSFFKKKERSYPKLAHEARGLLDACEESLEDAIWALDRMKYLAERGGFDWSISTCLKHKLL